MGLIATQAFSGTRLSEHFQTFRVTTDAQKSHIVPESSTHMFILYPVNQASKGVPLEFGNCA